MPPYQPTIREKFAKSVHGFANSVHGIEQYITEHFTWKNLIDAYAKTATALKENKYLIKEIPVGVYKETTSFGKHFALNFFSNASSLHILPSFPRIYFGLEHYENSEEAKNPENSSINAGILVGQILGLVPLFPQLVIYEHLARTGSPEVLLIPAATNLASAFYELKEIAKSREEPVRTVVKEGLEFIVQRASAGLKSGVNGIRHRKKRSA